MGLEAIKAEGGITSAQDETARFDSMPRSAIVAGCVDFVLSPERIAKELARIARHPYARDGSSTFALAGDEVQVNQRQALALGLGIHELATNAAKYGAFSVPSGKVDLSWDVVPSEKGPMLKIRWI